MQIVLKAFLDLFTMKIDKLIFLVFVLLVLMVSSCTKDEFTITEVPEWNVPETEIDTISQGEIEFRVGSENIAIAQSGYALKCERNFGGYTETEYIAGSSQLDFTQEELVSTAHDFIIGWSDVDGEIQNAFLLYVHPSELNEALFCISIESADLNIISISDEHVEAEFQALVFCDESSSPLEIEGSFHVPIEDDCQIWYEPEGYVEFGFDDGSWQSNAVFGRYCEETDCYEFSTLESADPELPLQELVGVPGDVFIHYCEEIEEYEFYFGVTIEEEFQIVKAHASNGKMELTEYSDNETDFVHFYAELTFFDLETLDILGTGAVYIDTAINNDCF